MGIRATGEVTVAVDRQTAFAFVRDPERLARCIPGCQDLRELAPDRYAATLSSRVAFMTVTFRVTIDVVRTEPPSVIAATITGDAVGLPGHMTASATVELREAGEGHTAIAYATEVGLAGRLGGLGEPVLRATSAQLARQFGANLKAAIESGGGAASRA